MVIIAMKNNNRILFSKLPNELAYWKATIETAKLFCKVIKIMIKGSTLNIFFQDIELAYLKNNVFQYERIDKIFETNKISMINANNTFKISK